MAKLNNTVISGFLLSETNLRRTYLDLNQRMKQITNDINIQLELKFTNGLTILRSSIDDVLAEENEGDKTICAFKMAFIGSANQANVASIILEFTTDPSKPISYSIESENEKWIEDALRDLQKDLKKIQKIAFGSFFDVEVNYAGIYGVVATAVLRLMGSSLKSSDYVFAWGEGLKKIEKKKSITNLLLVGVILAFVIGVASGITANYLSALLHIGAGK